MMCSPLKPQGKEEEGVDVHSYGICFPKKIYYISYNNMISVITSKGMSSLTMAEKKVERLLQFLFSRYGSRGLLMEVGWVT